MTSGGEDSGFADICVHGEDGKVLFIVECKTEGREYSKELKNTETYGRQLFTYWQQERNCNYFVLYTAKLSDGKIQYDTESVDCSDDSILLYKDTHTVEELYKCWDETYEKRFCGDAIFRDDSVAYNIGVKPLRKRDLKDFSAFIRKAWKNSCVRKSFMCRIPMLKNWYSSMPAISVRI